MTKDELNEVLKEDDLELDKQFNGIGKAEFIVRTIYSPNKQAINFNGVDFYVQDRSCFSPWTLKALADYAYTPIEERKPKPQLYNIIIAQEHDDGETWYTTWRKIKNSTFETAYATTLGELNHEDYQFNQKEIDLLKKELPENQKKIVDLGVTMIPSDKEKVVPF